MAYETPDNSFSAFRISDADRRTNGPLYSGKLKVDGKLFFVDIWENEVRSGDNAGDMYLGGKVKEMQNRGGGRGDSTRGESSRDGGGDRGRSTRGGDDRGGQSSRGGDSRGSRDDRGNGPNHRGSDNRSGAGGGRMNDIIDDLDDAIPF